LFGQTRTTSTYLVKSSLFYSTVMTMAGIRPKVQELLQIYSKILICFYCPLGVSNGTLNPDGRGKEGDPSGFQSNFSALAVRLTHAPSIAWFDQRVQCQLSVNIPLILKTYFLCAVNTCVAWYTIQDSVPSVTKGLLLFNIRMHREIKNN